MPNQKNYEVGSEIEALCNKCKAATVHVIEVIKQDKPTRVMCKSCESSHRFRSPEELIEFKKKAAKTKAVKSKAAKSTAVKTKRAASSKTPEQRKWSRLCNKFNIENPTDYQMEKKFSEHDAIQHKKFGLGVVVEIVNSTKMSVAFEEGIKTLVQNR